MIYKKTISLYIILFYTGFFINAQNKFIQQNKVISFNGFELGSKFNEKNKAYTLQFENNCKVIDFGEDSIVSLILSNDTIDFSYNLFYIDDTLRRIGVFFNGTIPYKTLYYYLTNYLGEKSSVYWDFSKTNLTTIIWKLEKSIIILISDDICSGGKLYIMDKSLYTLDYLELKNIIINYDDKKQMDNLFK